MSKSILRLLLGLLGLIALTISFRLTGLPSGLERTSTSAGGVPIEFVYPAGSDAAARPLVLIGHGLAGSRAIMRGFAYTIAKAGYVAASWDFDGHGANPNPIPTGCCAEFLANARAAVKEAHRLGLGDPSRTAILGHSMGSGAALAYGQAYPETEATIAVSPVETRVSTELPHNLLLMAGSREPYFAENARELLLQAGGSPGNVTGDPAEGTARDLRIIPGVEHLSILFAPYSHQAAVDWLDLTFGVQPGAEAYTDRRVLGYILGMAGALLAALALVPATAPHPEASRLRTWRRLLALAAGTVFASLLMYGLGQAGLDLTGAFGLELGGYLLLWFGIAGLAALLLLREPPETKNSGLSGENSGESPGEASRLGQGEAGSIGRGEAGLFGWSWLGWPGWKALGSGLLAAAFLWVGVGLLGGQIFLSWLLIPPRLALYPLAVVCMLPWTLAVGQATSPASPAGRAGWWLAASLCLVGGLLLEIRLSPSLIFLGLILPLFPAFQAAHALAAGRQRSAWSFGLSAALFLAWVVLAVFPLK